MSAMDAYGISVDVPGGWDGRIFRRQQHGDMRASAEVPGPAAPQGEVTLPVVQVATVPLPADIADYGSDVVGDLGATDALIVLKEFDAGSVTQALFALEGLPRSLDPDAFSQGTLQRSIEGQAGVQVFFHESNRAFCIYVVVGSYLQRSKVVPAINRVLASISLDPPAPMAP
jgi:hypothetical protein